MNSTPRTAKSPAPPTPGVSPAPPAPGALPTPGVMSSKKRAGSELPYSTVSGFTPGLPQARGLHSFRFQLNLSSSVHRATQLDS